MKKRIVMFILLVVLSINMGIVGYAVTATYSGCVEFLERSHLVYSASYSDMFRPNNSGEGKMAAAPEQIISKGKLVMGVEICNSDGTLTGSGITSMNHTIDSLMVEYNYFSYPNMSASAKYKAFLKPENGLHLYMHDAIIFYR